MEARTRLLRVAIVLVCAAASCAAALVAWLRAGGG